MKIIIHCYNNQTKKIEGNNMPNLRVVTNLFIFCMNFSVTLLVSVCIFSMQYF